MNSHPMAHPDEERLLRFADGELPARDAQEVRAHLEACWQCRIEYEEIQKAVGGCVRYRQVMRDALPPPPLPWGDIRRRLAAADAAARPTWSRRLLAALEAPAQHPRRWAPAALALLLVFVLVYRMHEAPPVEAAQLLRQAVAAAESRVPAPRRIQIKTRDHQFTRTLDGRAAVQVEPAEVPVKALFEAANYSWEDPLSARAYQTWRESLGEKRDEVAVEPDCYRIRTTTPRGELREATLKLRAGDLHPVESTLEFRNRERVEITEVAMESPELPVAAAVPSVPNDIPRAHVVKPQAPAPLPAPAGPGEELRVLAALHRLGADLGDPIEVTRDGGQILVTGVGLPAERKQRLEQALEKLPRVVVRFDEAVGPVERPERPATTVSPAATDLMARIEKQAGGRAAFDQLASALLDSSDEMMSRAYALRRLAERFPREDEQRLTSEERALLGSLQGEHAAALARRAAELQRLARPVLGPAAAAPAAALEGLAWQPATDELFQAVRRVETLLGAVFGGAPPPVPPGDLLVELQSALARLRVVVETYPRLPALSAGER